MKKFVVFLLTVCCFVACDWHKPLAGGSDIAIMTLVSPDLWEEIREDLSSRVEFEIRTPQIEKLFYFSLFTPEQYKEYRDDKLVMLIATLDGNDPTSLFIRNMIGSTVLQQVENGERIFFFEYDKFAERQTYMLLLAKNREELNTFIREDGNQIYQAVNRGFLASQFKQIYHTAEEKSLSESLYRQLGFSFRLPYDYEIIYLDTTRNILQLGVARPQRNIIVYWQDGGFNKVIDENYALRIKHWLMQNLMEKIYIEKSYARYRTVDWGGVIVNNIRGLWAHPTKVMGGPFTMFYFYDGVTDRSYFIDCMLFAPGQSKAVFLRQMEIVASTFYTSK
ncbi:MAG: DUF4837 family protein [Candidatus Marinimicrobia bacterium]|jgi:hypothetical protein|nr:DUF4837 family protein [Candidatus Neomarinimicrobiota bacterium]MDD4961735.1 DUF4837 family protein [Candidatus Neomarinimicrobiota bacterium]MDD5710402.1 DUF4837 family protein [Candidatus Neomarinimicrobiota bacterium]